MSRINPNSKCNPKDSQKIEIIEACSSPKLISKVVRWQRICQGSFIPRGLNTNLTLETSNMRGRRRTAHLNPLSIRGLGKVKTDPTRGQDQDQALVLMGG
jgi:hypothetical protein